MISRTATTRHKLLLVRQARKGATTITGSFFSTSTTTTTASASSTHTTTTNTKEDCRTYKPVPVPSGNWPIVGHLPRLIRGGDSIVNWQAAHDEVGGSVFHMNLVGKSLYVVRDPQHAHAILMNQGRDTVRTPQTSWQAVFDLEGWPYGIPFATGDTWKRRRKILAETLLQTQHAQHYVSQVAPIANALAEGLSQYLVNDDNGKQRLTQPGATAKDLTALFALQAVMKVVVGRDHPVFKVPLDQNAVHFVQSVQSMFDATKTCENMLWNVTYRLKPFQQLRQAWRDMYAYPSQTLEPILMHYKQHGHVPEDCQGTVLPLLLKEMDEGRLTEPEVLGIAVQAIAAAVDTTAQTMEYLLYNVATAPSHVQQRLHEATVNVVGRQHNQEPFDMTMEQYSSKDNEDMDYIKAVVRESMRFTPTIGVHARTLTHDIELDDQDNSYYRLPKGDLVLINYLAMTRNPDLYPRPDEFLPERFLKKPSNKNTNDAAAVCPMSKAGKAAAIPFGHGGRKCTGKGFAELDLHLALMALIRKYHIDYDGPPLVQFERQLLRPKEPLNPHFVFEERA